MTLLSLYWSIMIACYLIASKLRCHKAHFHFLDKLTSFFIYLLIFLMGLRMGADEEVTSSLGSIGVQALFITFLTAVGSMLGGTAARKISTAAPCPSARKTTLPRNAAAGSTPPASSPRSSFA